MSSLEWNKIAAALLTAGVIAMFAGFIAQVAYHQEELDENVYIAAVVEGGDEEAGEAAEEAGPEPILPLLASADVSAGEGVTKKCTACHTFEKGGANKIGPNLWNVVNRQIAGLGDFSYSNALQEKSDQEWTYEHLNGFIAKPKDWAPGTKMSFAGVSKASDRADLVAYMRTLSDDPAPLPSPDEIAQSSEVGTSETDTGAEVVTTKDSESAEADTASTDSGTEATQQAAAGAGGLGAAIEAASAEDGKKVSRKCAACHSFDEGGANKIGPNLYGVIGQPIASVDGFKYSDALKEKSGEWTYADLSAFLEDPKGWAPGTKMAFAGLKKQEDRAALLAYLREMHGNPPPLPE